MQRDPLEYIDGMSSYGYYAGLRGSVDPSGLVDPEMLPFRRPDGTWRDHPSFPGWPEGVNADRFGGDSSSLPDRPNSGLVTDDFNRECCWDELRPVIVRKEPLDVRVPVFGGHEWLEYTNPNSGELTSVGFYPEGSSRASVETGEDIIDVASFVLTFHPGELQDDSRRTPSPDEYEVYWLCPESVTTLHNNINDSRQNPPRWQGLNNCQHWCDSMIQRSKAIDVQDVIDRWGFAF